MPVQQPPQMKNSKSAAHGKYKKILNRGKSQSLGGIGVPTIVIDPETGDAANLNTIMPTFAATSKTIPENSNFIISNATIKHVAQDGDGTGETHPTKSTSSLQTPSNVAKTFTSARVSNKQHIQASPKFEQTGATGKFMSFSSNSQPHIGNSLITPISKRGGKKNQRIYQVLNDQKIQISIEDPTSQETFTSGPDTARTKDLYDYNGNGTKLLFEGCTGRNFQQETHSSLNKKDKQFQLNQIRNNYDQNDFVMIINKL